MPNAAFLVSPAYSLLAMSTRRSARLRAIRVSERAPWRAGSALKLGRVTICGSSPDGGMSAGRWPAQQVADEQRMPGQFGDHAHRDAVGRIGAAVQILDEQFAPLGVIEEVGFEGGEMLG